VKKQAAAALVAAGTPAPFVTVVDNEFSVDVPRMYTGKRYSPDLPGIDGRRSRPRWGPVLPATQEPYPAVIARLRTEWGSESTIAAGVYAVAFTIEKCPTGCAGNRCSHRTSDGVASEIFVVDPRAQVRPRASIVTWDAFVRRRNVHQTMRYKKTAAIAEEVTPGKGITKLLNETTELLNRARVHAEKLRNEKIRTELLLLIEQAAANTKNTRAKYQGLARR